MAIGGRWRSLFQHVAHRRSRVFRVRISSNLSPVLDVIIDLHEMCRRLLPAGCSFPSESPRSRTFIITLLAPAVCISTTGHGVQNHSRVSQEPKRNRTWSHTFLTKKLYLFAFPAVFVAMVFRPPKWVPNLDLDTIPDSIPVSQFMLDEKYGRTKLRGCQSPFICGLSGAQYTALEVKQRVDFLARGLATDLNWFPNQGSEWGKVITIFAHNTVSFQWNGWRFSI